LKVPIPKSPYHHAAFEFHSYNFEFQKTAVLSQLNAGSFYPQFQSNFVRA